ncbi:MAG: DUF433 domain-containing protein [Caldilinea sp. CFX5]|nr:DUF433 domain-containing protein [Caldilinea sp. CFX5]
MTLPIERQIIPLTEDQHKVIRVGQTRVTLDTVIHAFEQGHTAEEIVSHYPALQLADVYAVIAYYLNHRAEVRTYLRRQEAEAKKLWAQVEAKTEYQHFRERLLARL